VKEFHHLVQGCAVGHPASQKALYDQFKSMVFSICWRYTGNRSEAEDVFQEVFIRIFQRIDQLNDPAALEGWIRRISVNACLNAIKERTKLRSESWDESLEIGKEDDSALHYEDLMNLVQKLPPQYRLVFNLSVIEGYNFEEISEQLGISESTVRSNLHRARHWLQEKLGKNGY
jgi:RNA polymerase sigma-70 factor (ECF subfamily)